MPRIPLPQKDVDEQLLQSLGGGQEEGGQTPRTGRVTIYLNNVV